MREKILNIIAENFPNGLRYDFITDRKIRRLYKEKFGAEISPNLKIEAILERHCVKCNGKFYLITQLHKEKILQLVNEIISDNVIVFYSKLYDKHQDFFAEMNIFSAEVLRETLQNISNKYVYNEDFFTKKWFVTPQDLLQKYFQSRNEISLDDVEKIFPYIPLDVSKKILSADKNFLFIGQNKYILLDSIQFDEDEIKSAREIFVTEIKHNGHAILDSTKFPHTFELNPELSEANICTAVYEKFLSDEFSKTTNILTHKSEKVNLRQLIRNFCVEHDEITTDELLNYAVAVGSKKTSATNNTFTAAYQVMVRVSKDLFMRDSLIVFDVDGVDSALNSFVQDKIIALRDVNDFSMFPPVKGYSWNLYMLESFLRKYSRRYNFDTAAANNSLMGAIYPKSRTFENYTDVQASIIVQENIPLDEKSIAEFLISRGIRKTKNKNALAEILNRAQEILDF